jgi:hypothetical protein
MHTTNQPQTTSQSNERDAAIQINGAAEQGVKTKPVRPNVAREVKALNGTRGKGSYFVRVKLDREWNEIRIKLTDGTTTRTETFIDLGHTTESKIDALKELRSSVANFLAL